MNEQTSRHLLDLCYRSTKQCAWIFSSFLTLEQQKAFLEDPASKEHSFHFWGGSDFSERCIMAAGSVEEIGPPAYPISLVHAFPKNNHFSESLSHSDYLGALLNLGMDRSVLGDLHVHDNNAYFFCLNTALDFLISGLTRVRKTAVNALKIPDFPPDLAPHFRELSFTVPSERLDAIVAGFTGMSRNHLSPLFAAGKISVNSRPVYDGSKKVKTNDVITVKGFGKAVFDGISHTTRKGRYSVILRQYC